MSLTSRIYCLVLLLTAVSAGGAQTFSDLGLMSGSGLVVLPTATIAPPSEFRLQYARVDFLNKRYLGVHTMSLNCGLSSNAEAYIRFTGEQIGTTNSQLGYGFGGKITIPGELPVVRRLSGWIESTMSDEDQHDGFFPVEAFRAAAVATPDSDGVHPTFLAGIASIEHESAPMFGAGVTVTLGHGAQAGLELIEGYLGRNSYQAIGSLAFRVLPNISLHASPGYYSTSSAASWVLTLGITCTTAGIDFKPSAEEKKRDDFMLPSIEEIEKQSKEKHHD
ncbi:MAG TPA: hypothetical protein VL633_03620 [Bacteroidota bacterium]|jgi:hypothetical protein|nr:hypothetical protein [Bacteroidota bacterium]